MFTKEHPSTGTSASDGTDDPTEVRGLGFFVVGIILDFLWRRPYYVFISKGRCVN